MTQTEQQKNAKAFAENWKDKGDEKQETQRFWIGILGEVSDVKSPASYIEFEKEVKRVESRHNEATNIRHCDPERSERESISSNNEEDCHTDSQVAEATSQIISLKNAATPHSELLTQNQEIRHPELVASHLRTGSVNKEMLNQVQHDGEKQVRNDNNLKTETSLDVSNPRGNSLLCSAEQAKKIEQTAQAILDARAKYTDSSLADLYDETLMPADLRKAHEANDRAVMQAYGFGAKMTEAEIVAELFKLYERLSGQVQQ